MIKLQKAKNDIQFLLAVIDDLSDEKFSLNDLASEDLEILSDIRTEWEDSPDQIDSTICSNTKDMFASALCTDEGPKHEDEYR